MNFVGCDESERFGERHAKDLDILVVLELGGPVADVAGEVYLHPLAEEAGAGEVFVEESPALCAEAGFFDHLALGGSQRGFAGIDAASGQFYKESTGSVAILAFEDDVGVFGVPGLVYSEYDNRAVVANDLPCVDVAARLDDFIRENREHFAFVDLF